MPRGGRRAGTPGSAYGQRTDLNARRVLPVQTAPGQQYGMAAQQVQAQQAIPMGTPAPPVPAGPPAGQPQPAAQPPPLPFDRPTERPDEPVTAGLPVGPGPGPEALGPMMQQTPQTAADLLSRLAGRSPEIADLYQRAASGSL